MVLLFSFKSKKDILDLKINSSLFVRSDIVPIYQTIAFSSSVHQIFHKLICIMPTKRKDMISHFNI